MGSVFGNKVKISIFGESHGTAIGVVIDGLPSGERIDIDEVYAQMARRAPGGDKTATPRKEADIPQILSGMIDGVTTGAPLAAVIYNTNTRSQDYGNVMTYSVGSVNDEPFDPLGIPTELIERLNHEKFALADPARESVMREEVEAVRIKGDSIGGVVECIIQGMPAGIGEPMFGGAENIISAAVFGVPAVKGIEFGSGFAGSQLTGSNNNDEFYYDGDTVRTYTNNHGGILGGITSGMPIIFRAAVKPTPSISIQQRTIDLQSGENTTISVKGRHDPCIVPRAVPVIESAAAIAVINML